MPVGRPEAPDAPRAADSPETATVASAPPPPPPASGRDRRVDHAERALRGLVTTRGTQVPWAAATRAREVGRPTADDLARAEEEVVVVRRNYTPPEPLRNGRTGDRPRRRPG